MDPRRCKADYGRFKLPAVRSCRRGNCGRWVRIPSSPPNRRARVKEDVAMVRRCKIRECHGGDLRLPTSVRGRNTRTRRCRTFHRRFCKEASSSGPDFHDNSWRFAARRALGSHERDAQATHSGGISRLRRYGANREWTDVDRPVRFDVDARTEGDVTLAQARAMVRGLLEDRSLGKPIVNRTEVVGVSI